MAIFRVEVKAASTIDISRPGEVFLVKMKCCKGEDSLLVDIRMNVVEGDQRNGVVVVGD